MLKSHHFQQSLRTSTSQVSLNIYDQQIVRQPPQKIRQNKFTKTYAKLTKIPLQIHIPTLNPLNIQHLYISHNNIKSLYGIENYPNLVSLNVSYNRLTLIEELRFIQNEESLLRIGLKMNDFVYGYQDYAIKLFRNLGKIDDICVKDKQKVKEMWQTGQKVACDFLQFYIRIQRVLYFMNDLIDKSKLHQQMGLSQAKSKYPSPQLKLLFEHMTEQFIAKISSNYLQPTDQQFLHLSSLEILKRTHAIISVTLEEKIDLKCTCRPKLPYDEEIRKSFAQVCNKFLVKFSNRYNKELQKGLKKVQIKLSSFYSDRKWENWQLYGMVQNYLELGVGGKRISHIVDKERKKIRLFDDEQNIEKNVLKGKKPKKDDLSWRNDIFSNVHTQKQQEKENNSPNITYLLDNFAEYKNRIKRIVPKEEENEKNQPQMFFDRIPMILYEKNYVEILMEVTMEKIRQMLENYDYLVRVQKESIHSHIRKLETTAKQNKPSYEQKMQMIKKVISFETKRTQSMQRTERNNSSQTGQKKCKSGREERMLKSTIANNSPFYTQRIDQGAMTTTRQYLQRKDSQISFGKTNQDEMNMENLQIDQRKKRQKKRSKKSQKNQQNKETSYNSAQSYQFYEINLVYKVFRGMKLRVLKHKKKANQTKS